MGNKTRIAIFAASSVFMTSIALAQNALIITGHRSAPEEKRDLPFEIALKAAQSALTDCRERKSHATVAIFGPPDSYPTSQSGPLKVLLGDDASPINAYESVRSKAVAVYETNLPSRDLLSTRYGQLHRNAPTSDDAVDDLDAIQAPSFPVAIAFAGAVPIMHDGRLFGVIAVKGTAGPEVDELCAKAGVDRTKGRWDSGPSN